MWVVSPGRMAAMELIPSDIHGMSCPLCAADNLRGVRGAGRFVGLGAGRGLTAQEEGQWSGDQQSSGVTRRTSSRVFGPKTHFGTWIRASVAAIEAHRLRGRVCGVILVTVVIGHDWTEVIGFSEGGASPVPEAEFG